MAYSAPTRVVATGTALTSEPAGLAWADRLHSGQPRPPAHALAGYPSVAVAVLGVAVMLMPVLVLLVLVFVLVLLVFVLLVFVLVVTK